MTRKSKKRTKTRDKGVAYTKQLVSRFGRSTLLGEFRGYGAPVEHQCLGCGKTYVAAPRQILSLPVAACYTCRSHVSEYLEKAEAHAMYVSDKFDHVSLLEYAAGSAASLYRCHRCNQRFTAGLSWTYKTKYDGCPTCAKKGVVEAGPGAIHFKYEGMPRVAYPHGKNERRMAIKQLWRRWETEVLIARASGIRMTVEVRGQHITLPEDWHRQTFEYVEGFIRSKSKPSMRLLALDPGTANCAWTALEVYANGKLPTVLGSGMIGHTVQTMIGKDFGTQLSQFVTEVKALMQEFGVEAMAAERFMYRRGLNGTTMESVGAMIGALALLAKGIPLVVFPASQWKNSFNAKFDLEKTYATTNQVPHIIDSMLIGVYASELFYGQEHYQLTQTQVRSLLKKIEHTRKTKALEKLEWDQGLRTVARLSKVWRKG